MKKKIALPLLLALALLVFSGIRLWTENRIFDNVSFFLNIPQYLASYFDEEVLLSLIFIESDGKMRDHQRSGHSLVLISEENESFTLTNYSVESLKVGSFLSPYSIFRINIALELNAYEHLQMTFNEIEIGGHKYDIGEIVIEKIPPIGDLNVGVGATMFSSRINYLELIVINDEVEPITVTGVIFYLNGDRINILEDYVLLSQGEAFDCRFDLSFLDDVNFSIVPKIEIEFLDNPIFLRTPSSIHFVDDIMKEDIGVLIKGDD